MSSNVEPHEPRDDGADSSALQAGQTAQSAVQAHDITVDASRHSTPDNEEELRVQIDETREQLGKTVEQLAAKADIKRQARVKGKDLASHVRGRAARSRESVADRWRAASGQSRSGDPMHGRTPDPGTIPGQLRRTVTAGAGAIRRHPMPAAATLVLAIGTALWWRKRR